MPHPIDITHQVINRLMNLKSYTVTVPVRENWIPNGRAPFDIRISRGMATVTIPALSRDEARSKAIAYFDSSDRED